MSSSADVSIKRLVTTLSGFYPGAPMLRYISHIRFPNFKNIAKDEELKLNFPLIALVGANGSGKSSILHALYGAPKDQSTSRFWFSTDLDPISDNKSNPSRYIVGHWNDSVSKIVETRKARVSKPARLDYWEPTKRTSGDHMEKVPPVKPGITGLSKDRWNPPEKDVVYINFKCEFGSFDKYFYFDTGRTLDENHRDMRREAKRIRKVICQNLSSLTLYGYEKIIENRDLSNKEIDAISTILGREYQAARLVRHRLYPGGRGEDISVLFNRGFEYSEAFAGSGEVAIVSAVVKIMAANNESLILLDEPETSLHPGAQVRFLEFLLKQIKVKKHQIVISTHSPEIVERLPQKAIKVLSENVDKKVVISNECSPYIAFHRLQKIPTDRIRVVVEDELAAVLVRRAISLLDEGEREVVDVSVVPGGASSILGTYGPVAQHQNENVYFFMDGDQSTGNEIPDPDDLPASKDEELDEICSKSLGVSPKLLISGGDDPSQAANKAKALRSYLGWIRGRLSFLPRKSPEHVVLAIIGHDEGKLGSMSSEEAKAVLYDELATPDGGSAADILAVCKYKLGKADLSENTDIIAILDLVKSIIKAEQE
ncbi:ATP-binding protein [Alcanivorax sp. 1008]|uniref:ATP-dependent nuclease n=1 Tax=Alcanivorax sp. 1008 TaxID=2816853 RepID=UPI001D78E15F|nr:AAA family ATPase [Alcanivorax sp. 1008]